MDEKLKQRLIGALVLVIAAVVFLPMLLSGQDETVRIEVDVPAPPVMDNAEIPVAAPIELPDPEPIAEIPPPAGMQEPEVTSPAVAPPAEPETPPATTTPPAATPAGDWVVQLGSFSAAANAQGLKDTLLAQGYNAYTLNARIDGKDIVRVYVGPLVDRAGATRVRDELARRHSVQGIVVAYDASSGKR
ncbi:MAG: cell division protein [Gammaproteobacteria bacterium HGW-Gammaproteobacteria-6]|nr:MAG: cell division protein [Gammaproteobacteria bacterium HGW-Gammaproteobacteria-6]